MICAVSRMFFWGDLCDLGDFLGDFLGGLGDLGDFLGDLGVFWAI